MQLGSPFQGLCVIFLIILEKKTLSLFHSPTWEQLSRNSSFYTYCLPKNFIVNKKGYKYQIGTLFFLTRVQIKGQQYSISWFDLYVAQKQRNNQAAAGWQRFQHPTYNWKQDSHAKMVTLIYTIHSPVCLSNTHMSFEFSRASAYICLLTLLL